MKIALGQINTTVGDFDGNAAKIRDYTARARAQGCAVIVFPELTVTGYPPRDFLELPAFLERSDRLARELSQPADWNRGIAVYFGAALRHPGEGSGVHNAGILVHDGRTSVAVKTLLPTYDVFDEGRYFDAATEVTLADAAGSTLGLSICEDIWNDKEFWRKRRYARDPVELLASRGSKLVLNISASPYARGRQSLRESMVCATAKRHRVSVAFVNLVGGNDGLVFDGHSALVGPDGTVLARAPGFDEAMVVCDLEAGGVRTPPGDEVDQLHHALVVGVRDYARKTGFRSAVLGLSGGIDSSLTAVLAVDALGKEHVHGVAMPSRYSASMSEEDARSLADHLGISLSTIPIEGPFRAFLASLEAPFAGRKPDVAEENLQARIRGTLLMALSNKFNWLLLTTGNKSELAVGYCTLYGDMAGGLAVIGDVPKTTVYALAKRIDERRPGLIPERCFTRPPSAELRPDQTDQDSLPPYEVLDDILAAYVEERLTPDAIAKRGHDPAVVSRVLQMVMRAEYKRRQAAPTIRVSGKAFGEGWRFPIAHGYRP